jgi:hypothetical protein
MRPLSNATREFLMTQRKNLVALLAAGAVTVLVVAGFSNAAGSTAPASTKAAPVNTAEPKVSGTAQVGETLSASSGSWTSSSTLSYAYQWRRCNAQGNGCANIGGADNSTYLVRKADVGDTLRVRVTAKNSDGSAQSTSNETAVVKAAPVTPPPVVNGCPSGTGPMTVNTVSQPARLVIDGQTITPSVVTRSTSDLTVRFHVSACSGRSVSGALVYATAVPFQQFSIPAETPTGEDGWATMTMHQDRSFPASPKQQLLAVFVRARKPGEALLGGISTRRLASFPVHV